MPSIFRPEASPDFDTADCLPAFIDVIDRMAEGDILQLGEGAQYVLSGPLEIAKGIIIQEEPAPHYEEVPPSIIFSMNGVAGLRLSSTAPPRRR